MPITLGPVVPLGEAAVEVIETKTLYAGFRQMHEYTIRRRLFNGQMSDVFSREVMSEAGTNACSVVLPYDPVRDKVILIEQFRISAYAAKISAGWTLEPVAGRRDAGETAERAAVREMREEAGATATKIIKIGHYLGNPGGCSEDTTLFICSVDSQQVAAFAGLHTEQEDIRTHILDFDAALEMADSGFIKDANCLLALNWLARHRARLRQEWSAA